MSFDQERDVERFLILGMPIVVQLSLQKQKMLADSNVLRRSRSNAQLWKARERKSSRKIL